MDRIVLLASEGMIYTNGNSYGKEVYLAHGETGEGWYEISEEDFEKEFDGGIALVEATERDYQSALAEFGVDV